MLTIENGNRLVHEAAAFPALSRIGLLLMVAAGAFDVLVHLTAQAHVGHDGLG